MKDIEKQIGRKINQAILKYKMIHDGDRVLVAVSGGKDSMTLIHHLNKIAGSSYHINFEIHGIHIKTDFENTMEKGGFEKFLSHNDIPCAMVEISVLSRLKPGRKMNCYWCSSQRRMELMKYASENGYNKIALGHHMDDILETFFMNMAYKGELSTMLPLLKYDNYEQTVIRPMALVKEREIIEFADISGISKISCTCNFDTQSKRKEMRSVINLMAKDDESLKDNIYKAMSNPVSRYMPGSYED